MTKAKHSFPLFLALSTSLLVLLVLLSPDRQAPRTLEDGSSLASLVSATDTSFVVIYDPANCFRCDVLLPLLQSWATTVDADRFVLVLTRPPTEEQRHQMALLRIAPIGVVRGDFHLFYGNRYASELLVFVDGTEVSSIPYDENMAGMPSNPILQYITESAHLSQAGLLTRSRSFN